MSHSIEFDLYRIDPRKGKTRTEIIELVPRGVKFPKMVRFHTCNIIVERARHKGPTKSEPPGAPDLRTAEYARNLDVRRQLFSRLQAEPQRASHGPGRHPCLHLTITRKKSSTTNRCSERTAAAWPSLWTA